MSSQAYEYGVLLKPKVLLAMLALYLTAYFTSSIYSGRINFDYLEFFIGFMAVTLSVSGANGLNCVIDRDIDALMVRTSGRPLVRGSITVADASLFSWSMLMASGILAVYLGPIPTILLLEGAGSYLLLYTVLFKRKTSINVLFTAPSVAAPAWFGWYLGGAPLIPVGLLMGILVAIWGPLHLWSIAFAYSKDYVKAGVPMLPSQLTREQSIWSILVALGALLGSSYLLAVYANSFFYTVGVSILNTVLTIAGIRLYRSKSNKDGWVLFKLTAPYILLVFLIFMLSQIV